MSEPDLSAWVTALCNALGVDPAEVDVTAVLDLARDAAHGVARPAAPVSAFVVGLAVGRGLAAAEAFEASAVLANDWAD
jgi:hypothetical protein